METKQGECPLCKGSCETRFQPRMNRSYNWCTTCDLVTVSSSERLRKADERARYLSHNNSIDQPGYVRMLLSVLDAAEAVRGQQPCRMLDFGCGYAPVLGELARRRGYAVDDYDPLFFPDPSVLERRYDLVTSCEVAEHARDPVQFWVTVTSVLRTGGIIAVRSSLHPSDWDSFLSFWYTFDETHVSFYSSRSISYVCSRFGFELRALRDPIWVLQKR